MDKYYYLVAQLPFLMFNRKPAITTEKFLEEAEKWLTPQEYDILSRIDLNDFYPHRNDTAFLRDYKTFERYLRSEMAKYRQARKTKTSLTLPKEVIEIKDDNPLEIEKKLLYRRWAWLEDKETDHSFDFTFLIIYFLKLKILERLFTFDKQKGKEAFMRMKEECSLVYIGKV